MIGIGASFAMHLLEQADFPRRLETVHDRHGDV
jgi:hypothetical protein